MPRRFAARQVDWLFGQEETALLDDDLGHFAAELARDRAGCPDGACHAPPSIRMASRCRPGEMGSSARQPSSPHALKRDRLPIGEVAGQLDGRVASAAWITISRPAATAGPIRKGAVAGPRGRGRQRSHDR